MSNVALDDVEIHSYNSTQEELEHAVGDDWRNALPAKTDAQQTTQQPTTQPQPQQQVAQLQATQTTEQQQTQQPQGTQQTQTATQQQEQPRQRPEGWVPRKHLESSLKTEKSARERAVADNVRLTQELRDRDAELSRLRNGVQPQAQPQTVQQPAKVEEPKFAFAKVEPKLIDFKDAAGNLRYEDYDTAWRKWQIERSDAYADWKANQQTEKLPTQIKQHEQQQTQAQEQADQQTQFRDFQTKLANEKAINADFQRVMDAPIAPPANQARLFGAMTSALIEVSNPTQVMTWIADNQEKWREAVGIEEGSPNYNITVSQLQHRIFQLSEHLEEQEEAKKNSQQQQQANSNGNGNNNGAVTHQTEASPASNTQQQTQLQQPTNQTAPVPMPASSAPAPSASSALRGSARTTTKNLHNDDDWKGEGGDDAWIAQRRAEIQRNRLPRGRSRF